VPGACAHDDAESADLGALTSARARRRTSWPAVPSGIRWLGRPSVAVGVAYLLLVGTFMVRHEYRLVDFVHLGTAWTNDGAPENHGYDGQNFYRLARDPFTAHQEMDFAPFRYQRILYPLIVRLLTAGQESLLPFALLAVNALAVVAGVEILSSLLRSRGLSDWYSLPYGFYFGQMTAFTFDLAEPTAYALVCLGIWLVERGRIVPAAAGFGLAALTRETTVLFVLAYLAHALLGRRWREACWLGLLGVFPLALWLLTIVLAFGRTGLGFSPPFETMPFAGIVAQWEGGRLFALLVLLIAIPTTVSWLLWGQQLWSALLLRRALRPLLIAWGLNLAVVTFLSHYSYLELVSSGRIATAAILSALAYGALVQDRRILLTMQYHVLTCPIYLAGVWIGIRSLIV
jgi:hypothetical protein